MNWKDKKLWICAGVYVALLLVLSHISVWDDRYSLAPQRILFEILTPLVWMLGIYWHWAGRWQKEDNGAWTALLVISALPHIPLSLVGAGSWLCLAGSALLGVALHLLNRKHG